MRLRYVGKRDIYPVILGHRRYIFKGRGFEIDVPDKDAQLILQMASYEFRILPDEAQPIGEPVATSSAEFQVTTTLDTNEPKKKKGRPKKNAT